MTVRISACLIVRDEERFLPGCLRSLKTAVDEIIVVDTGSTDRTIAIAADFGAEVHFFPWGDDFSAARNFAREKAKGDWIFHIDADERLLHGHGPLLRQMAQNVEPHIYGMGVFCYSPVLDGTCAFPIRVCDWDIDMGTVIPHPLMRIHRNLPGISFQNRAHEQFSPSVIALGGTCVDTPISIWHEGYRESYLKAKNKLERNRRIQELDLAERPDDGWVRYNMGRTLAAMERYSAAEAEFRLAEALSVETDPWRSALFHDWDILKKRMVPA